MPQFHTQNSSTGQTPIGRPKTIDDAYIQRLSELVQQSPKASGYAFDRWTAYWLREHLLREFGVAVTERHINRLLRQMGLSTRQRLQVHQGKLNRHVSIAIVDLPPNLHSPNLN
jgi:transposase